MNLKSDSLLSKQNAEIPLMNSSKNIMPSFSLGILRNSFQAQGSSTKSPILLLKYSTKSSKSMYDRFFLSKFRQYSQNSRIFSSSRQNESLILLNDESLIGKSTSFLIVGLAPIFSSFLIFISRQIISESLTKYHASFFSIINLFQFFMNPQLKQEIAKFPQWITQFEFDPYYGYLIDPDYSPKSFKYGLLQNILKDLHTLNATGQIIEKVDSMPYIKISQKKICHKDMVILHDGCSYLLHSYIKVKKDKGVGQDQIRIPKNLALSLAESASFLKVKTGMATGICYNWYFKEKPKNPQDIDISKLTIHDIVIRSYFADKTQQEHIFMGVSVLVSLCLKQIIKNSYEINKIILLQPNLQDEVSIRMAEIRKYLKKIFQTNLQIHYNLQKQFFFYVLRIFVAGYKDVFFEGIEQKVSSSGGAGGYDPSFQTFERAFGIHFEGELGNIQEKLRNGMPEPNRNLVDFMAANSLIREYCQCSPELQTLYNGVIEAYVRYLQLHGTFIKNFIIHQMPVNATRSSFGATGATMIKIVDRYQFVREQELKE